MTKEQRQNKAYFVLSLRHEEVAVVVDEWLQLVQKMSGREASEIWSRSALGSAIKGRLVEMGYWKNKPRGNPSKGYQASRKGNYE